MILDLCLPRYDFHEVHSIQIEASAEEVYKAVKEVTFREIDVAKPLFWIRGIPARLKGQVPTFHDQKPMLEQMIEAGFSRVAEAEGKEVVIGLLTQPWKPAGGKHAKVTGLEPFISFHDDDLAKIAMNFCIQPTDTQSVVKLTTETRIAVPNPANRRKFAVYWFVIYPGSALLRRMWLLAIKKRAAARSFTFA